MATADNAVTCVGYVGTGLDEIAFVLAWVPGGQPFAGALGLAGTVVDASVTGYQVLRFAFDPNYRTDNNYTGIALNIGSLVVGVGGHRVAGSAERQATTLLNEAVSRHAPETVIKNLEGQQENAEILGRYADAFFGFNANAISLVNTIRSPETSTRGKQNDPCIPCATHPPGPPYYDLVPSLPHSGDRVGTLYAVMERKRGQ